MIEMKFIRSNSELEKLHDAGVGLVYNDFSGRGPKGKDYNVLHAASCSWVVRSNVNVPKYFFKDFDEAIKWLRRNRGSEGKNWKRCGMCRAEARPAFPVSSNTRPIGKVKRVPVESRVFTEREAEASLVRFLESNGYSVRRQVRVASGLIDVVADGPDGRWFIEAKGEDRGGYTSAEMNFQLGLGQLMSRMKHSGAEYALAFPLTRDFMKVLHKYKGSLAFKKLGIHLIVVKSDGVCRIIAPNEVLQFLEELDR